MASPVRSCDPPYSAAGPAPATHDELRSRSRLWPSNARARPDFFHFGVEHIARLVHRTLAWFAIVGTVCVASSAACFARRVVFSFWIKMEISPAAWPGARPDRDGRASVPDFPSRDVPAFSPWASAPKRVFSKSGLSSAERFPSACGKRHMAWGSSKVAVSVFFKHSGQSRRFHAAFKRRVEWPWERVATEAETGSVDKTSHGCAVCEVSHWSLQQIWPPVSIDPSPAHPYEGASTAGLRGFRYCTTGPHFLAVLMSHRVDVADTLSG